MYAMLNDQQISGRFLRRTFKWQHDAEMGILQLKLILCKKGKTLKNLKYPWIWRRAGGVESVDLNGKMLEMKISTDMEMAACLIKIEENCSAALRACLFVS